MLFLWETQVKDVVMCQVQLERPSDGSRSEPRDFQYLPLDAGINCPHSLSRNPLLNKASSSSTHDMFRRILAADSGFLVNNIRFLSDDKSEGQGASSHSGIEQYFDTLRSYTKEMKADLKDVVGDLDRLDLVPQGSLQGDSPPPLPPKRLKRLRSGLPVSNTESSGDPLLYHHPAPPEFFEDDEKLALYTDQAPLANMSELDDLETLSLYSQIHDPNGNLSGSVPDAYSGQRTLITNNDNKNNNVDETTSIYSFVTDPDYVPLPVLDLFV